MCYQKSNAAGVDVDKVKDDFADYARKSASNTIWQKSVLLRPHEVVMWQGAPNASVYLATRGATTALGVAICTGLVVAVARNYGLVHSNFASISLFASLFSVAIPPALMMIRRAADGLRYTVTDQRVIIESRSRVTQRDIRTTRKMKAKRQWSGFGSIVFERGMMFVHTPAFYNEVAFQSIPEIDRVVALIANLRAAALALKHYPMIEQKAA